MQIKIDTLSTIITSVLQTILNVYEFNMTMQNAVDTPRFHHQWLPETITVENNFPESTIAELKNKNYIIEKTKQIGKTEMIGELINNRMVGDLFFNIDLFAIITSYRILDEVEVLLMS